MDSRTENEKFNLKTALEEAERLGQSGEHTFTNGCIASLGAEVQRLRAALTTIAFPRRGSPEAGWGIYDIARFAAKELRGEREERRPVEGDSVDKPMRAAFLAAHDLDSAEEAGFNFANATSESESKEAWGILMKRAQAQGRVLVAPAAQREAFVAGAHWALDLIPDLTGNTYSEAARRYPDMAGEESREDEESSKRADDLANAFANGTFFMATHPDCTTDQVFAEANRRYSTRL